MKYKLRDDIILERVSGIDLLVALRSAWGESPFAIQIAPVFAYIWRCMKKGMDEGQIIEGIMETRKFSEEKAKKIFGLFIRSAEEYHYFSPEDPAL